MITVYGFRGAWGLVSVSPFCSKLEIWLRMAGIPYRFAEFNPMKAPRGKAPYIHTGQKLMGDSDLIIKHLTQAHNISMDEDLDAAQRTQSLMIQRLCEHHLYHNLVYSRWMVDKDWPTVRKHYFGHMPAPVRMLAPIAARKKVRTTLQNEGTLKYSHQEILDATAEDIDALAHILGENPFFLGDVPRTIDAITYSWLESILLAGVARDFGALVEAHPNLVSYCQRMRKRYVEDYTQPEA